MKVPRNVEYTSKINNCIDELLMQDTTFNQQLRKNKLLSGQNEQIINRRQLSNGSKSYTSNEGGGMLLNVDKHDLLKQPQPASFIIQRQKQRQKQVNFPHRRRRQNRQHVVNVNINNKTKKQQQPKSIVTKNNNNININNNNKDNIQKTTKAQQKYHTINIIDKQQVNKLRLKKTYSYEVKDDNVISQKSDIFDDCVMEQSGSVWDSHSPMCLLGTITGRDNNYNNLNDDVDNNNNNIASNNNNQKTTTTNNNQNNPNTNRAANKYPSIRGKLKHKINLKDIIIGTNKKAKYQHQQSQYIIKQASLLTNNDNHHHYLSSNKHSQYIQQQLQQQLQLQRKGQQFHLTHEQLQFLSLLYPNESPQQLMLKLLSYYQQQQLYNNSFQQLFQSNQQVKTKDQQFFRTKHQIQYFNSNKNQIGNTDKLKDQVIESEQQSPSMYNGNDNSFSFRSSINNYDKSNHNPIQNKISTLINKHNNTNKYTPTKSNYSKLKQQCLASIGQQMVQTQIKSSLAQTVNVNYYTRQYAMPIIMETINQKNQQAQNKLNKLQEIITANQEKQALKIEEQIIMTLNQQKIAAVLAQNYQSINTQSTNIPSQFTHKVYIPANSRGQSFEMDYKPDSKLFEYISQNEYRRILRDINHLIQKVLSYHRHSSFLKRKTNSLLKGWNLTLLLFLFLIIVMLCVRSFFIIQSNYLQIVVFFCLSFIVILILGNSFNNYKRNVKRSSVIKDICQQLSNYLDFINSSNKNIKWVLGKDFFWLQIWIDVIKNKHHVLK